MQTKGLKKLYTAHIYTFIFLFNGMHLSCFGVLESQKDSLVLIKSAFKKKYIPYVLFSQVVLFKSHPNMASSL